jgi:hypothetical protein
LHANSAALRAGSAKMRAIKRKIVKEQQVPNIYIEKMAGQMENLQ